MKPINELISILWKIREGRKILPDEAYQNLIALNEGDFPPAKWNSKMGIQMDFGAMLFYAEHDWDNEWAQTFLDEGIKRLRREKNKALSHS